MQGLLIINKPKDITSFGAVARVRRIANTKKVGHTGTLDPMATGVLPIFVGRATQLCSFLLDADKTYTATFLLGTVTDTCDVTGNLLSQNEVNVNAEQVLSALEGFIGKQLQIPPAFSAIKQGGVPMYKLARRGEAVEIPAREITVHSITPVSGFEDNKITVSISCSKGTYIRSICRDLGERLGCGATLFALRRDATSGFTLADAVSPDDLSEENIEAHLISAEKAVEHLRSVQVSERQAERFRNGGKLSFSHLRFTPAENGEILRIRLGNELIGLGEADLENEEIRIKCIL